MSDTGIRQFSCIRQVTDTGNILVTTAERVQHLFDGNYAFLRARILLEIELRLLTLNSL